MARIALSPVTSDQHASLPRTIRGLVVAIETAGGTARWRAERSVEFTAPRPMQDGTRPQTVVGHAGWFVRDGRNHIGGRLDDVQRAAANATEGRDPFAPRRTSAGNYVGRDHAGRFAVGSQTS